MFNIMNYEIHRINKYEDKTLLEFEISDISDLDIIDNIATFFSRHEDTGYSYKKSVINLDYYIIFRKQ